LPAKRFAEIPGCGRMGATFDDLHCGSDTNRSMRESLLKKNLLSTPGNGEIHVIEAICTWRNFRIARALLIIDEVGFEAFSRADANLIFRLVSYRYQRGAICITSNKEVKDWPEMLAGDEVITAAILDCLLHSSHVL
jgi:hypothetical protein